MRLALFLFPFKTADSGIVGLVSFLLAPVLVSVAKSTTGILGSLAGSTGVGELEPDPGAGELEAASSKFIALLTLDAGTVLGVGGSFAQSGVGTGGRGSLLTTFDFGKPNILGWLEPGAGAGVLTGGEIIILSSDEVSDSDSDLGLSASPGSSMSKEILVGVKLFLLDIVISAG